MFLFKCQHFVRFVLGPDVPIAHKTAYEKKAQPLQQQQQQCWTILSTIEAMNSNETKYCPFTISQVAQTLRCYHHRPSTTSGIFLLFFRLFFLSLSLTLCSGPFTLTHWPDCGLLLLLHIVCLFVCYCCCLLSRLDTLFFLLLLLLFRRCSGHYSFIAVESGV